MDIDDSPWDSSETVSNIEWSNLSNKLTNAGYREGIVVGKEAALQPGFDAGFALGAPLGRELGALRGVVAALLALDSVSEEARQISAALASIRLSDIAPRDLDAEQHAREHLDEPALPGTDDLAHRADMEGLEDMLHSLSTSPSADPPPDRPTRHDMDMLRNRLLVLSASLGLNLALSTAPA